MRGYYILTGVLIQGPLQPPLLYAHSSMSAHTCLYLNAASMPTPSGVLPVYPSGQGSQRKPGRMLKQRTFGSQGLNLHCEKECRFSKDMVLKGMRIIFYGS